MKYPNYEIRKQNQILGEKEFLKDYPKLTFSIEEYVWYQKKLKIGDEMRHATTTHFIGKLISIECHNDGIRLFAEETSFRLYEVMNKEFECLDVAAIINEYLEEVCTKEEIEDAIDKISSTPLDIRGNINNKCYRSCNYDLMLKVYNEYPFLDLDDIDNAIYSKFFDKFGIDVPF